VPTGSSSRNGSTTLLALEHSGAWVFKDLEDLEASGWGNLHTPRPAMCGRWQAWGPSGWDAHKPYIYKSSCHFRNWGFGGQCFTKTRHPTANSSPFSWEDIARLQDEGRNVLSPTEWRCRPGLGHSCCLLGFHRLRSHLHPPTRVGPMANHTQLRLGWLGYSSRYGKI